ncbi:hypothetical protein HK405_004157 [Cladochytrium tenue]|nr:hypothetical protein HK405_004157 [Cladochytrium tenue]
MSASETKPWADGPLKLIPSSKLGYPNDKHPDVHWLAFDMLPAHNYILRTINAIYLQAINVGEAGPDVIKSFLAYCRVWHHVLDDHHKTEEEVIFPKIEAAIGEEGYMSKALTQHEELHPGLEAFGDYVKNLEKKEEEYDGKKLREIIDSFAPILARHLEDEIDLLIGLREDKVDWKKVNAEVTNMLNGKLKEANVTTVALPFIVTGHDKTFDNTFFTHWPPVPWIVISVLRFLFFGTNKDWWQFAPCDGYMVPKELPYA